jgi:hypothetical protein
MLLISKSNQFFFFNNKYYVLLYYTYNIDETKRFYAVTTSEVTIIFIGKSSSK